MNQEKLTHQMKSLPDIAESEFFTTEDHPFWTTEGWKSANKTMSNKSWYKHLNCGILEVGDFIFSNTDITANSNPASTDFTLILADQNIAGSGATDGATPKGVAGLACGKLK